MPRSYSNYLEGLIVYNYRDIYSIWLDYQKLLKKIYKETKKIKGGRNAHYIPELAKVNSNLFGISICDVKGNLFSIGDHNKKICY